MQVKMPKNFAIVTGGATRIGKDITIYLHKKGFGVIVIYNKSEIEAQQLANNLQHVYLIKQDLYTLQDSESLIRKLCEKYNNISLLINNASIFENDTIDEVTINNLERHMKINCFAPIMLSKAMAANRLEEKINIVNIIDSKVTQPGSNFFSYRLSKSALLQATKELALQLAPNCRVNSISPGLVYKAFAQKDCNFKRLINETPLGIRTISKEICEAIDLLISSESITGTDIIIDSGISLI